MTYQEILAHIYGLGRFGMKPGLTRIRALLRALGNPHESIRTIQIAGTNGKGSTAAFLASIVAEGGYRVGLFTSPHLIRFTERIRINGAEIGEEDVVKLAERVFAAAPRGTTFFEIVTALAFLHFAEQGVELAVMEAGMGGRFDATSVTSGILSIITPISLDHCEYLGDNIAAIALDKAGIIRPGAPLVCASQQEEAAIVIGAEVAKAGSQLMQSGRQFSALWEADGLAYHGLNGTITGIRPGIAGIYQLENAACALCAAELLASLGLDLPPSVLQKGIERASWPGRMELVGEKPRFLLDGAHNPDGARALAAALTEFRYQRLLLVAGVMGDKDLSGILGPLLPLAHELYAVSPSLERALPSSTLAEFVNSRGVLCHTSGNVANGLAKARAAAGPDDLILVCGSLFTVGEARALLMKGNFEPFRG